MKAISLLCLVLFGLSLTAPYVEARGDNRGGRSKATSARGGGGSAKRSPMTGSRIERPSSRPAPRPASRPTPKPAARPQSRPATRPEAKPARPRPETKPATRPVERPSVQKPSTRPAQRPGSDRPELNRPGGQDKPELNRPNKPPGNSHKPELNRPDGNGRPGANHKPGDNRPGARPDHRPSMERPAQNRPNTLPGMVSYPNRPHQGKPNRPNAGGNHHNSLHVGDRTNGVRIDNSRHRNNVHIDQVNVGRRNVGLNRPATLPAHRRPHWDDHRWGGNRGVWGNHNRVNIQINNNFRYNNNFSYRPNCWGARPWWGAGHCHAWHHGHWGYGYSSSYYRRHWYYDDDNDFAKGFMWGIGVWSLGNLIYDMGYQSYRNPYPAPAVHNTYVTYSQPVSVAAAAHPPGDEQAVELAETKSNEALERSRAAFQQGDYLAASKAVDEAIGHTPGDATLHEYRALVFFALGKYPEAAGVLNPVLASGPGWSWDTMIGFYRGSDTYQDQLRTLESYVKGAPAKADARFLLGYHYMVCGHMEPSYEQFAKASELQPADSISRQLRDLTKSSIPDAEASDAEVPARPDPVSPEQLVGTWVSNRGADGTVTFTMTEAGDYTWSFMNAGHSTEMTGTYGLNDKGLLVLTSEDSQMVSAIEIKEGTMHFVLIGAPDGDPGLDFTKG